MPNHIKNIISFKGNQTDIDELFCFVKSKDDDEGKEYFDFNKIIPMPDILADIEESTEAEHGAALLLLQSEMAPYACGNLYDFEIERIREATGLPSDTPIRKIARAYLNENPETANLGRRRLVAINETGYASWYPWSIESWGTKWNSYDNDFSKLNTVNFKTAWSMPEPIMKKLSELFPKVEFEWKWADEDKGNNCGIWTFENGELFCDKLENGSNEAYCLYIDCWGKSKCLYQEDGVWKHHDCDTCTGCD